MILNALDHQSWLNFTLTCKKHHHLGTTEQYFKSRLLSQYDKKIILLKSDSITYKQQYIDIFELLYVKGGEHWMQRPDLMLLIMTRYPCKDVIYMTYRLMRKMSPVSFEFYCEKFGHNPCQLLNDHQTQRELFESDNVKLQNYCLDKYLPQLHLSMNTIDSLCKHNNLERLKVMLTMGYKPDVRGLYLAIKHGQRQIVDFLIEVCNFKLDSHDLFVAAIYNHPEIYTWLADHYFVEPENLLDYLIELDPEMVILFVREYKFEPDQYNMDNVVFRGHVPAVKLLMEECALIPTQASLDLALANDHFDVLVYLWTTHKLKPDELNITTKNLSRFQWYLNAYDIKVDQNLVNSTCHLEILQYLYTEYDLLPGNYLQYQTITFETAQWLEQHGRKLNLVYVISDFAMAGNLKGVRYFASQIKDFKLNLQEFSIDELISTNSFHIVEYIRENQINFTSNISKYCFM